jgi:Mlc titration factor MtfA (ptsG expression regulator)
MCDGHADGVPPLPDAAARERWVQALSAAHGELCHRIEAGQATLIDPYAAQGLEEFFAVCTEAFFVAPADLLAEHPQVYAQLRGFFAQDPAQFMS